MNEAVITMRTPDSERQFKQILGTRLKEIEQARSLLTERKRQLDAELSRIEGEREHVLALLGEEQANVVVDTAISNDPVELVVRLLRERGHLHYREIERELRSRGWYQAGGADPANTLLAKYFDDPRLYRPARGQYALRPEGRTVQSVGTKRKGGARRPRNPGLAS
jgi:hypothetical protein